MKYRIHPIEQYLDKDSKDFTKEDIIRFITENEIRMVNYRYVGGDGRLKMLNFVIHNEAYLDEILTAGERVDGSSLFKFIDAGNADLYVIPRYSSAFIDPFTTEPTISFLCSYFDKSGKPLESSPEYILKKAHDAFKEVTGGMEFHAMGELEYYVISDSEETFETKNQRGYHEAGPFSKHADFRQACMLELAKLGAEIKYGHNEVGNFTSEGKNYEQNEIEFLPVNVEKAVEHLLLGKWVIYNLAREYGLDVTFAPKISVGKAGSGMHVHTKVVKDGINMYVKDGKLSDVAKKAIAGMMSCASSLTAFGNTNPTSYLRLVPHQEAPTNVCWGDRNRSVLVRVPLGWTSGKNMAAEVNPLESKAIKDYSFKQTIEIRCPDGSANLYFLLAGITVAARHGFEMPNALEVAEKTYVDVNIHREENKDRLANLNQLPTSCFESADQLIHNRAIYEGHNVFSPSLIDAIAKELKAFNDQNIRQEIEKNPAILEKMVKDFYYC